MKRKVLKQPWRLNVVTLCGLILTLKCVLHVTHGAINPPVFCVVADVTSLLPIKEISFKRKAG